MGDPKRITCMKSPGIRQGVGAGPEEEQYGIKKQECQAAETDGIDNTHEQHVVYHLGGSDPIAPAPKRWN